MGNSGNANAALLRAMDAVSMSGSPENWEQLYKELLDCRFVIPIRDVPEDVRASVPVEEGYVPVSILQARDNSGKLVTLAFTGIDALRDWNADVQYVEVPSRQFFQTIKTTEIAAIIINLHRPDQKNVRMGGRLTRFEFSALAEGMIPGRPDPSGLVNMNVPEGMDVYIADPETPPSSRILESAVAAAAGLPEVQQLYLFQMTVPGGEPHNVIGIDVAEQPRPSRAEEIMRTMAQSVNVLLGKGEYLDLLLLGGPLGEAVRSRGKKLL